MWVRSPHTLTHTMYTGNFPTDSRYVCWICYKSVSSYCQNTNELQLRVERLVEQTDPHCGVCSQENPRPSNWLFALNVSTQLQESKASKLQCCTNGQTLSRVINLPNISRTSPQICYESLFPFRIYSAVSLHGNLEIINYQDSLETRI